MESESDRSDDWTALTSFIAVMFGILGFFIALGTIVDLLFHIQGASETKRFGIKLLLSFSLYSNFNDIMSSNTGGKDTLTCLHGIRFISMTWVVLGHNFLYMSRDSNLKNFSKIYEFFTGEFGIAFAAVANGGPSVDSFFLMR